MKILELGIAAAMNLATAGVSLLNLVSKSNIMPCASIRSMISLPFRMRLLGCGAAMCCIYDMANTATSSQYIMGFNSAGVSCSGSACSFCCIHSALLRN